MILRRLGRRLVPFIAPVLAIAGLSAADDPPAGALRTTGTIVKIPSSIPSDCSVDATDAVNAFLASVPDGVDGAPNVAAFKRSGCYLVDGTVWLSARFHLIMDGNGATFRATRPGALDSTGRSSRRHIVVVGSADVTVQGLTVIGTDTVSDLKNEPAFGTYDTAYAEENGVAVVQSDRVLLRNMTIRSVWGNGVELDAATAVTLRLVTIDQNGNNGVKIRDSKRLVIDQVALLHSRRMGFKIEPEAKRVIDSVDIGSSSVCSHGPAFFSSGIEGVAGNVSIHHNRVDCGMVAQVVRAGEPSLRTNWSFTFNTVTNTSLTGGAAMLFSSVTGVRVDDNVMTLPSFATPVEFRNALGTLEVQRNDLRAAELVYTIDGVVNGPGVDAWANTTALGPDQPEPAP